MSASLVGSEMCIRDSFWCSGAGSGTGTGGSMSVGEAVKCTLMGHHGPVSYTHLTLPTICSV
eukprot:6016857-Alexandrium_andersonii.AAC.1